MGLPRKALFTDETTVTTTATTTATTANTAANTASEAGAGEGAGARSEKDARCHCCRKRLKPWDVAAGVASCRCGGVFCAKHVHFTKHKVH